MEGSCDIEDWTYLPKDVLDLIISNLYGEDVRSFHSVCRTWQAAEEYAFQKEHNPLLFPDTQSQWLLHKQCSELPYQFIHPVYPNVRFVRNLLEDDDNNAMIRHSKDGWLLMSRDRYTVFLLSPFPKKLVITLPDLPWPCEFDGVTFSCSPTSSSTDHCVIFGISCLIRDQVSISTIILGENGWENEWKQNQYDNNIPFRPAYSSPVYRKDMFYCLSLEGNLGTYDPKEDNWTVLEKLENPISRRKRSYENHLVEHEGSLMSLFMGESGSWVSIFKLNEFEMSWQNVYSLGDYALFVSVPTSFATKKVLNMMRDKIFFPFWHENYLVFYCLETKTFRTYGSNLCVSDFYKSEIGEQLESSWYEPRDIYCEGIELDRLSKRNDVEETDDEDTETEYETVTEEDEGTEDESSSLEEEDVESNSKDEENKDD